ncbi:MAG: MFS transporter [Acidobacteria bacterium]|nr:MFS transporter [Acidobacteriota bacterium]
MSPLPAKEAIPLGTPSFQGVFSSASLVVLVGLLLGSTTINYIDRQVLSVLAPLLRDEFHLSNAQYAGILNAFLITYAFSYALTGWVIDRLGVGRGLTLAIIWWSTAGMLTALARGPLSLGFFRALLAVGEGGGWPSFAKAVAMWVPPHARTLAIGVCNSGSSLGAMIAPPLVVFVTARYGWRAAFIVTGAIGFLWVLAFQLFRYLHPQMRATDRGHSPREAGTPALRWRSLIGYRQTWAVFLMRFFADPLWYFYAFWIPEFLTRERGLNLASIGAVAWIPFLVADIGNLTGGYITLRLQRAGWSVNRTRKTLMLLATLMSPIAIAAVFMKSLFWTIAFLSVAIFFWMFWSITVHTLPGDYFPPHAVASVFGFGGTGSTVGSVISMWAVGQVLDLTHSYVPVFVGVGLLMPLAFLSGSLLMGRVEPVRLKGTSG